MADNACILCLVPTKSNADQILCFGSNISPSCTENAPPMIKNTVADILLKHFWFELNSENDANAFVCQTCWTKVYDFHQFYRTVLVRHQTTSSSRWQKSEDRNGDVECELLEQKYEIVLPESKHLISNDLPDENDWHHDDDIGKHENDSDDDNRIKREEQSPIMLEPTKRKRGRPRKSETAASQSEVQQNESILDATTDADLADFIDFDLLARYFTLQCDLCSAPLTSLQTARSHHQNVHKQRGYLVCGCGKRFVRAATIREHCAFHVDPSENKCLDCCKIFTSSNRLVSHRRMKHRDAVDETRSDDDGTMMARDDSELTEKSSYNSLAQQRRDDELLRGYISLACSLCGMAYSTFSEVRRHYQQVHSEPGYVECCGKRFHKKCRAVQHCRWHANPRQFDCKVCGLTCANISSLREHIVRRHPSDEPFSHHCDQCDSRFQLQSQLRYHQHRFHTPQEAKRFECYRCHRRFVFMSQLRSHMRDGHEPRGPSHVCDVCAKYFKSKATYELHYALEHGTVSLKRQCPECGKWLKHAGMVARHMKQHRAEPTACEDCGHVSPSARALYSHRRLVHGAPRHKCLVCGKMFKKLLTLREHMAIHAGITDLYTCAYCPKTFRSISNMYKHRRQTHAAQFEVDRVATKLATDRRNEEEAAQAAATAAAESAATL